MKKNTLTFALLLFGAVTLSAQIQLPKKAPSKEEQILKKNNKKTIKIPKVKKLNGQQVFDLKSKSLRDRALITKNVDGVSKTMKLANASFGERVNIDPKIVSESKNKSDICTTRNLRINVSTKDFGGFTTNGAPDWMRPGLIMSASSFLEGRYMVIDKPRQPIEIYTNLRGNINTKASVTDVTKSGIDKAVNSFQSDKAAVLSANFAFKHLEVNSFQEAEFRLNGSYSNLIASGKLGFESTNKNKFYYYMVDFVQNMFHVDVEKVDATNAFKDPNVSTEGLLYISRVTYGRRGIIVVKSKYRLSKIEAKLQAELNTLIHKGKLTVGYDEINEEDEYAFTALYYGGDTRGAIESIENTLKGKPDIISYLNSKADKAIYAVPIGYQLKNMYGESLGMQSVFNQNVGTCVPEITKSLKLRVTLTDLICAESKDGGGNGDDYGLNQYIVYKVKGKEKKFSNRDIIKFSNRKDLEGINKKVNKNQMINGNKAHQIHVREGFGRTSNINNSMVFEITPDALNDSNTKFEIHTWLKEYTGSSDEVLTAGSPKGYKRIKVPLKKVVGYLLNPKNFENEFEGECFPYDSNGFKNPIMGGDNEKCWRTGTFNDQLFLFNAQSGAIDGPISLGRKEARGAVWMRFELVD